MEARAFVFLADIRGSTELSRADAAALRARILQVLPALRARYRPTVGLDLVRGDEIAGVFADGYEEKQRVWRPPLHRLVVELRGSLRGLARLRYSVAYDTLGPISDEVTQIGGLAFKQANHNLQRIKRSGRFSAWSLGDALGADEQILEAMSNASDALVRDMTDYQFQVYARLSEGGSQKSVAEALGKSPQSVSDAVKRGRVEEAIDIESAIDVFIQRWEPADGGSIDG